MVPGGRSAKARLPVLDGLRGVAALIVVAYHIFDSDPVNLVNHGYLAVDFFFLLSGFVTGYAYDDRWGTMSFGEFVKRRLIRLHPMVVIGSVIGAVCFYFGASDLFGLVERTSFGMLLLSTLLGALLIPSVKAMDVRGWGESYPLNGPMWSLFFEYLANLGYGLWFRKLGLRALGALAAVCALLLGWVIVTGGSVGCGWLFTAEHVGKGVLRMLFPFLTGLFLFRLGRTIRLKHAMPLCSLALLVAFLMPRVGAQPWMNGLYECAVLMGLLPVVVLAGAGSQPAGRTGGKVCDFLGDLSYPLYLTHYPVHYVFFAWLNQHHWTAREKIPAGVAVYLACLVLGYAVMRCVDTPVRKWLGRLAAGPTHPHKNGGP